MTIETRLKQAALVAVLALAAPGVALAHGGGYGGMGYGMMGPGYGAGGSGYGYGMGPGMMAPGYGPGGGYGMGPGMMGPGYGPGSGMGYGMMGPGYGAGPGTAAPGGAGPGGAWNGGQTLPHDLSVDEARQMLEHQLAWQGNPNLQLGSVEEKDADTIVAEIVTKDGSLVRRIEVDRHTGRTRPVG